MNFTTAKSRENIEGLISPYCGELVNLLVEDEERRELTEHANKLSSLQLSPRSLCDLELLSVGAFSPLDRFMGKADYTAVLERDASSKRYFVSHPDYSSGAGVQSIQEGKDIALRSPKNELLAIMTVEEVFEWNVSQEARLVLGTNDVRHPLIAEMASWGKRYISGPLKVINLPKHYDFVELRRTPAEVRSTVQALDHTNVVAFQTRNPIHRAHEELTKRAAAQVAGALLIHPVVGMTKPGDVDHYTRVRAYKALVERYYDKRTTVLSLLPLAMRMAGPREAVWHAIIRRNYGANHFIVGRDHAGPGVDSSGRPFYGPYDAQNLLQRFEPEVGVKMIPFREIVYLPDQARFEEQHRVPRGTRIATLSGTQVRDEYLSKGVSVAGLVHAPRNCSDLVEDFSAYPSAGILPLVHRSQRRGQVHHRGDRRYLTDGTWQAGNPARWRRCPHSSIEGLGIQQGRPRYEHSSDRFRSVRNCPAPWFCNLRGGEPLSGSAQRMPQYGREGSFY